MYKVIIYVQSIEKYMQIQVKLMIAKRKSYLDHKLELMKLGMIKGVDTMQKRKLRKLNAWGKSTGIRLPKDYCAWLHLDVGTQVEIELDQKTNCLVIRKA